VTVKSRLAKFARITGKVALGLVAFAFLIALAWALGNSFDTSLSEQAKALLTPPPNPYATDENIYLAMAGLEGPAERSIIEIGQERIEAYNRTLDSIPLNPESALELNKQWDAAKLKVDRKVEELGHPRTSSIWTTTKTHRQDVAALLTSNQTLYQRYLSLRRQQGYYETARPSFMSPVITPPQSLRTLFLADVANRIQTGTTQQQREALNDLQQDLHLWRTVLKGDGTLISKMLPVAFLHTDMILLADLITDSATDLKSLEDALDPIVLPYDPKDYRIGNAFAAEFRGTASVYQTITAPNELSGSMASSNWRNRVGNAFQAHFFKLNATENISAAVAAQRVALGNSDPGQFYVNRETYRAWLVQNEPRLSPALLYNPIGKILVKLAVSQDDAYYLRAYDVAAYQRLVFLAYQLKRQHIANADLPAFLKAHPDWSTHPVDSKPFQWNADTGELAVSTLGDHPPGQRFSVMLR
jgi:hypothetical protein